MPLYEYECEVCDRTFQQFAKMEDRHSILCEKCGKLAKKLISVSQLSIFKPMVLHDLTNHSVSIDSKAELNRVSMEHGVSLEHYNDKPKTKKEMFYGGTDFSGSKTI